MAKKLAIRALQRGIGSMDFIDMLLIREDPDESSDDSSAGLLATPLDPSPSTSGTSAIHLSLCLNGVNVDNAEPCRKKSRTSLANKGPAFL